ncbi:DsbA family oxidoreductase [Enterococcus ureilyticus]|uniref:DsbA family oxidoreductase n=1 Tax=Enterococcus ureilyticus TaxID=1131292 RepID=UPI000AFE8CCD|nr:DsbA family protein [Enterococcus ureilyticus]MBM7688842.1 putative DsbA family dithiol-disulfide isomerase [Enterococcus ureilyticus]
MITIEFFHDVICSFCFPMSYRMRQVKKEMPEIKVIHRSFALARESQDHDRMFGSRENAKKEILSHWFHANQNDELHRFNIEGMRETDFLFPTSMNGLLAAKAAGIVVGEDSYWDVFDALQAALFMDSRNIDDLDVLEAIIKNCSIDFEKWQSAFTDPATLALVEEDFNLANAYQLTGVPALIVNGKYLINGAQPMEQIIQAIQIIKEKESPVIEIIKNNDSGDGSCNMEDGKWVCKE